MYFLVNRKSEILYGRAEDNWLYLYIILRLLHHYSYKLATLLKVKIAKNSVVVLLFAWMKCC